MNLLRAMTSIVMRVLVAVLLLFVSKTEAKSVDRADNASHENTSVEDSMRKVVLFFRLDDAVLDRSIKDNAASFDLLEKTVRADFDRIISIEITGTTSPEGKFENNRKLAMKRADILAEYLAGIMPRNSVAVSKKILNYNWDSISEMVADDPKLAPVRDRLSAIITNRAFDEVVKTARIMRLDEGITYKYLRDHILPRQRTDVIIITMRNIVPEPVVEPEPEQEPEPVQEPVQEPEPVEEDPVMMVEVPAVLPDEEPRTTALPVALRTNLLFDMAGAPNLGVEIPIGGRFSIALDGAYAYWRINNKYALQTIQGGVEGRYWFDQSRRVLTGWNAGVYGMYSSRYDVQWKDGWQGDGFWSAGLSAGYSMPVGERFNLEFGIAAGYFFTPEVRHYHLGEENRLMWQETRYNMGRISLTKVKINLIWLIGNKK